jgi:hypothetical protein
MEAPRAVLSRPKCVDDLDVAPLGDLNLLLPYYSFRVPARDCGTSCRKERAQRSSEQMILQVRHVECGIRTAALTRDLTKTHKRQRLLKTVLSVHNGPYRA